MKAEVVLGRKRFTLLYEYVVTRKELEKCGMK
jgi:hypothetical protein